MFKPENVRTIPVNASVQPGPGKTAEGSGSGRISIGKLEMAVSASGFDCYPNVSGRSGGFLKSAVSNMMVNFWDDLAPEVNAEVDTRWGQFMCEEFGED